MFDIGWSELVVIAVVALIAIGPKELPGVLRMVGQWIGKARRMASDFQGQFNEAMREAEMADIKKTFDDAAGMAKDLSPTNLLAGATKDIDDALKLDTPSTTQTATTPTAPAEPTAEQLAAEKEHAAIMAAERAIDEVASPKTLPDAKAS